MDNHELQKALLQAFSEEAPEILQKAESALLDFESSNDATAKACIDALKRALHSLKGSASAIGRADIRNVCHAMEDVLSGFMSGLHETSHGANNVDKLHAGMAYLKAAIADPATPRNAQDVLALLSAENYQVQESVVNVSLSVAVDKSQPVDKVVDEIQVFDAEIITATAAIPVEKGNFSIAETIRVSVDKIEKIQSTVGELVAIRLQQDDGLDKLVAIQDEVERLNSSWQHIKAEIYQFRQFFPGSAITKLDSKLSTFNSTMKSSQRQVFHLLNQIRNQAGQLSLLSDEMDSGLRAIRMMPIGPFFESYRSVARDAARQINKNVVIECIEKGIEIDRLVLEKIKEPLLHLIRNCVSHGIETTAERLKLNKPASGNIKLTAELSGDYVYIQVIDDGAGFNRQKIQQKAFRHGLIKNDEELTNEKILELVSRPGFSTANQTDMLSGRGIGMDVVLTMLTELGGKVELETEEGLGSCFTLQVPSSLATTQGLIIQTGSQCFGIALDMVERIVRTKIEKLSLVEGKQVLYIDDEPIAVTSLAAILNLSRFEPRNSKHAYPIVILKVGNRRLALIVDDIPGEIPLIIKSMGPQFERISIYSGGAILPDGGVLPVVNARQMINMVADNAALRMNYLASDSEEQEADNPVNHEKGLVIVVDDSITTRTLERNILEAAGYTVSVATDGIEALDLLVTEDHVSLLVTDMEMPRMNGIELCRNIRAGRYADLPIIMVTSVGNEVEMRKGLEAGADAYIVKSDFQQEHFLEMVSRFARF